MEDSAAVDKGTEIAVDPYEVISSSNNKYSFHDSEKQIIDELREWSKEYFSKFLIFDTETHIPPQDLEQIQNPSA